MKRFVIRGRRYGGAQIRDIVWCDSNPEPIARALREKSYFTAVGPDGRTMTIGEYDQIEIVDNLAAAAKQ